MNQYDGGLGAVSRVVSGEKSRAPSQGEANTPAEPRFRTFRLLMMGSVLGLSLLALGGCATYDLWDFGRPSKTASASPPPAFTAADLVGRWGVAAYHSEANRDRTVAAAHQQCRTPYTIERGPNGGVMMHLIGETLPQELEIKGSPSGTTYIGPAGEPGGPQDRAVVSFDGATLIVNLVDQDAAKLYGTMVYVRCGPHA